MYVARGQVSMSPSLGWTALVRTFTRRITCLLPVYVWATGGPLPRTFPERKLDKPPATVATQPVDAPVCVCVALDAKQSNGLSNSLLVAEGKCNLAASPE